MLTLSEARAALCDLLIGRRLRARAEELLSNALLLERIGVPFEVVLERLDSAAHMEWIAWNAEQGNIGWGGRLNRCGSAE